MRLPILIDVHMFNCDLLLSLASISVKGLEQSHVVRESWLA
jgi:hypothetical protein